MSTMKTVIAILTAIVVIAGLVGVYVLDLRQPAATPTPSVVATPFADDTVRITSPLPGAKVSSPLTVTGEVKGSWYFEASFPVKLTTASGVVLAQAPAHALSNWMTADFVPFTVTLTFPAQPAGSLGHLILKNDNPSGDPARDQSRDILVHF